MNTADLLFAFGVSGAGTAIQRLGPSGERAEVREFCALFRRLEKERST
jgi:hypothetical protein